MAYETLHEAVNSSRQCAIQLFYSVRNMFELFYNVVPTFHKDNLHNLPQVSGKENPLLFNVSGTRLESLAKSQEI